MPRADGPPATLTASPLGCRMVFGKRLRHQVIERMEPASGDGAATADHPEFPSRCDPVLDDKRAGPVREFPKTGEDRRGMTWT
jgi:hypothetical protein